MTESEPSTALTDTPNVTFNVKGGANTKYELSLPATATVADIKTALSTSEHADTPADRQRLIYSGRVLKDADTISSLNIKTGHTLHLVKSAASNVRQAPDAQSGSTTPTPAANIPTNIAAGTGNNPLAGITGARYAGMVNLPSISSFGADGGMGPPMSNDDLERMMDNPEFARAMTEMMNNPQFLEIIEQSPALRNNPMAREMFRNPEYRRLLMSPEFIRNQLRLQRAMGAAGPQNAFPAPGATDNTPQPANPSTNQTEGAPNPFSALFGPPPATVPNGLDGNQMADLLNMIGSGADAPTTGQANTAGQTNTTGQPSPGAVNNLVRMLNMVQAIEQQSATEGGDNTATGTGAPAGDSGNNTGTGATRTQLPWTSFLTDESQTEALRQMFSMMGNPGGAANPPPPADNRPPEEQYATQLGQLNAMGFFDFERNVTALRRSGGNVEGAVTYLLENP